MIFTVSTVKDSGRNIERFVTRNLSAGADHMVIFLEGVPDAVARRLLEHDHVTIVRSQEWYRHKQRPPSLNVRQTINANLVNCMLAPFDWATWLFHIDGDECLDIDKAELSGVGADVDYVLLRTREAVSQTTWDGDVRYFKRPLRQNQLALLHALGVIDNADNESYFNGHLAGKVGIRPSLDKQLHIHRASLVEGEIGSPYAFPDFNVLHYESFSAEEFLRKWAAHVGGENIVHFRTRKQQMKGAVAAVNGNSELSPERKQDFLLRIYQRNVEDDLDTLLELGYVGGVSERRHQHTPEPLKRAQHKDLERLLGLLLQGDTEYFRPAVTSMPVRRLMAGIQESLRLSDYRIARGIATCLQDSSAANSPATGVTPS